MQIAQIDWMDFVVVETIDFKDEERLMNNNNNNNNNYNINNNMPNTNFFPQNQFQPPLPVSGSNINKMNNTNSYYNMENKLENNNNKNTNDVEDIEMEDATNNVDEEVNIKDVINIIEFKFMTYHLKFKLDC